MKVSAQLCKSIEKINQKLKGPVTYTGWVGKEWKEGEMRTGQDWRDERLTHIGLFFCKVLTLRTIPMFYILK